MEILSWLCTLLVLVGYYLNSNGKLVPALITWCIGDIGWIIYDFHISNWSHATLSTIIILINVRGLWKKDK